VPSSSRTKFFEALAAGDKDADLRSAEELRKLLGVKKGQKVTAKDKDGLDGLLAVSGAAFGFWGGVGGGVGGGIGSYVWLTCVCVLTPHRCSNHPPNSRNNTRSRY